MTTNRLPQTEQNGRFGFPWGWALLLTFLFVLLGMVITMVIQQWDSLFAPAPLPTAVPDHSAATTEPKIQISPTSGGEGTQIAVWGEDWAANDIVRVYLDDLGSDGQSPIYANTVANDVGQFFTTFTFPTGIQWRHVPDITVLVESAGSERKATAVFQLLPQTAVPTAIATLPPTVTPSATPIPTATIPPTATMPPTANMPPTATPTPSCSYSLRFVADISIPDDTAIQPGVGFLKTWRLYNNGTCAWPAGSSWVFVSGSQMGGPAAIPVAATNPGEKVDVSVYLVAPTIPGSYSGYWMLRLPTGTTIGDRCFVRIIVPAPTPTPTPTPTAPPVIYNWRGEYFANRSLAGEPVLVRDETAVNFNWGSGTPAANVPTDNFSARWTRSLYFEESNYRFYIHSDDGVRLWIDHTLRLDQWHDADGTTYTVDVMLTAGNHLVQIEFYEAQGIAQIQVWWEKATVYTEWRGEYWANRYLAGTPAFVRNDTTIDFAWGEQAPFAELPTDEFSARWTQTLNFVPGTYRLYAAADDGVRVAIDNLQVINEWHPNDGTTPYTIDVFLEGQYTVYVDYFEAQGRAKVHVWYELIEEKPGSIR